MFGAGVCLVVSLQFLKSEFRSSGSLDSASFLNAAEQVFRRESGYSDRASWDDLLIRVNQGWIISRILMVVPDQVPFANGETVVESLQAAFVPESSRLTNRESADRY